MKPDLQWLNFIIIAIPSALLPWITMKLTQKKNRSDTWEGLYRAVKEERDYYRQLYLETEKKIKELEKKINEITR